MPDGYGIKDLPDTGSIVDSKVYLIEGKWLNVIFSVLGQLWRGENVNKGPNIFLRQFGLGGYSISAGIQDGGSGGGSVDHPYKGYDASTGSTPKVMISYGTHNSTPPNLNGTPIHPDRSLNILTLDGGSSGVVYAECDFTTGGVLSTASINSYDNPTPPANTIASDGSGSAYQTLFAFTVTYSSDSNAHVTVADNVVGSQGVFICGTNAQFYQGG